MMVMAFKPFRYSPDGSSLRPITEGEEFDCRDDIVDGLIAEEFVASTEKKPAKKQSKTA